MALPPKDSKGVPFEQIKKEHVNRWVAVVVTKRDENGQPTEGVVVAEDFDRYRLRDQIIQYNDICIFFGGEPPYPLFL